MLGGTLHQGDVASFSETADRDPARGSNGDPHLPRIEEKGWAGLDDEPPCIDGGDNVRGKVRVRPGVGGP